MSYLDINLIGKKYNALKNKADPYNKEIFKVDFLMDKLKQIKRETYKKDNLDSTPEDKELKKKLDKLLAKIGKFVKNHNVNLEKTFEKADLRKEYALTNEHFISTLESVKIDMYSTEDKLVCKYYSAGKG